MTSMVTRRTRTPASSPRVQATEARVNPTPTSSHLARCILLAIPTVFGGFLFYFWGTHSSDSSLGDLSIRETYASTTDDVYRYPKAERLVVIGDLHGDFGALRRVLIRAAVLSSDSKDTWVGGSTVLVQVGDQQDRGDQELQIYDLLYRLQDEAPKFGGAVHILLGNHELMNSELDLRYVTRGGFEEFENRHKSAPISDFISDAMQKKIRVLHDYQQPRAWEVVAGGNLARQMARRQRIAVIIGNNLFVHGGLSVENILRDGGIDGINEATRKYLEGESEIPYFLDNSKLSPLWLRMYSQGDIKSEGYECGVLRKVLQLVGVKRMIVGHTVQREGINSRCDQKIWRADVGLSSYYGGETETLLIRNDSEISIFTMTEKVNGSMRSY